MKIRPYTGLLCFAAIGSCMLAVVPASADEMLVADANGAAVTVRKQRNFSLEEVVVTARKREENIQETPVAVTAISGDDLRALGIASTAELAKSVPSLQINDSTSAQIYIRGVGQRAMMARFDPSVSVYFDGIFMPRPDGQLLDTIDVSSVQVLRGPQGTLFGKNNTGGALVYTLTKPGDTREGYVEAELGRFNEQRLRAAIDMPVSDDFSTRLALSSHRRDGYLHDISGDDNQSIDRLAAIFQTRWLVNEALAFDTVTFLGRARERYPSYHCKIVNDEALFVDGLGLLWPGDTDPSNPRAYRDNCEANDRDRLPDLTTNQGPNQRQIKGNDTVIFGATLDWELNENHSLKSILGYRGAVKLGNQTAADEGGPADFLRGLVLGDSDQESLTLEFQLNGMLFEDSVDYAAGLFWQDEYKDERWATTSPMVGGDAVVFAQLAAGMFPDTSLVPPGGTPVPLVGALVPVATVQDYVIEGNTYAAFAQATWHISEAVEWTFGGRYTEEVRNSELLTRTEDKAAINALLTSTDPRFVTIEPSMSLHSFAGLWAQDPISIANSILEAAYPGEIHAPLTAPVKDTKDSVFRQFTPMTSLAWKMPEYWFDNALVDSAMVYATWSNGFKSGFHEPSGVDGLKEVAPEKLDNRELGFKIDALQNSLRMNVALYSMIFEDMQLITVNLDSAGTLIVTSTNAGESTIEGGELELSWLPSAAMMITLTYSNNNYSYQEFKDIALAPLAIQGEKIAVDRSDEEFAVSPRETASLGMQYIVDTPLGRFVPRVDVSYKSRMYMGFDDASWDVAKSENSDLIYAPAYTLIDARLSWTSDDELLNITLFGKNLTDERYDIGAVATAESLGTYAQVLGEPRVYGVELYTRF